MSRLLANGCYARFDAVRAAEPRPCLFLDRDGVVIEDRHHLADPAGVALIPPTVRAIAYANRLGWFVGLVTNQSGVGRGLFGWAEFEAVQRRVSDLLATEGAALDFVCACPHHPDAAPPWRAEDHPWRKPRGGMLLHAIETLGVDARRSIMVGDRDIDVAAGTEAGVGVKVLYRGRLYQPSSQDLPTRAELVDVVERVNSLRQPASFETGFRPASG